MPIEYRTAGIKCLGSHIIQTHHFLLSGGWLHELWPIIVE